MSLPTTMKALILEEGKLITKENVPLPKMDDDSMLVKTKAVGANPFEPLTIDYKLAAEGSIMGCDLVGEIVQIGKNVDTEKFQIGDIVSTIVNGGTVQYKDNGAYSEYVKVQPEIVFKFPQNLSYSDKTNVEEGNFNSLEACASFPMVFYTALAGTFCELKLNMKWEGEGPQNDHPILIWGGATGVGQYAIQLAKYVHGFTKIITVASKKHEKMLRSFGADEVFDYHEDDVVEQITKKYDNLQTLMDCRSTEETTRQTYKCASRNGKVILMQYAPMHMNCIDPKDKRDNVEMITTSLYQMNDVPIEFAGMTVPALPEYRATIIEGIKYFNPRFISGDIKCTPLKMYKGFEGIIEMVDDIRHFKNSGVKFVSVL